MPSSPGDCSAINSEGPMKLLHTMVRVGDLTGPSISTPTCSA